MNDTTTVLGKDCTFKGDLVFSGACRILGGFEGTILARTDLGHLPPEAESEVRVEGGGITRARIEADRVVVEGLHTGDIIARTSLHLGRDAKVKGDVTAGALSVSEGASFEGRVCVGPEAVRDLPTGAPAGTPVEARPEGRTPPEVTVVHTAPARRPAPVAAGGGGGGGDDWLTETLKPARAADPLRWGTSGNVSGNGGGAS